MSEKGSEINITPDCIDLGRQQLEIDPEGQVFWIEAENHAVFIPAKAQEEDLVIGLWQEVEVSGKKLKVQSRTVGQIKYQEKTGETRNITALLKQGLGEK